MLKVYPIMFLHYLDGYCVLQQQGKVIIKGNPIVKWQWHSSGGGKEQNRWGWEKTSTNVLVKISDTVTEPLKKLFLHAHREV